MTTTHVDAAGTTGTVLSFESAVPRRLVHRSSVAEVFLTDCVPAQSDRFHVAVQWPRLHGFYRTHTGRYDTMLLAETLRQTAIYLAHRHYRVALGRSFVMESLIVNADPTALTIGVDAAEVRVDVTVSGLERRGDALSALTVSLVYSVNGREVGSGQGAAKVVTPATYSRIRWGAAGPRAMGPAVCPDPVQPDAVGVARGEDVVLGVPHTQRRWPLRINDLHPVLFDHPCDHVPGMLILEAMRQGARMASGLPHADMASIDAAYHRFVEIDQDAQIAVEVTSKEPLVIRTAVEQWGRTMARGTIRLERSAR